MFGRSVFRLIAVTAFSVAASHAFAQSACESADVAGRPTVAELRDLQGNVLVSDAAGMASAGAGQRIKNKVRVTTTAKAGVTIAFDCGCSVSLKENQRLDVDLPATCPAVLAAVATAAPDVALGAVPAGTAGASGAALGGLGGQIAIGAAGVGGYLIYRHNRNVSPN